MEYNDSQADTDLVSHHYQGVIDSTSMVILVLAICAIAINLLVLLASKFTTGGRDAILVFVRSLCVADTLLGLYGVTKFIFITQRPMWVNCFLPDALLICAFLAANFTLIGLLLDCCTIIGHIANKSRKWPNSKYKTIFLMVYMWNGACILAFLPQMGWNHMPYSCAFFQYHSVYYLSFISVIFFTCIILMIAYTCKGNYFLRRLFKEPQMAPNIKLELCKIQAIVVTSRVDVLLQVIAFLPLVVYLLLHCNVCVFGGKSYTDTYLLCLIPIILCKSIICGIIRGKRTSQISQVLFKHFTLVRSVLTKTGNKQKSQDIFHIETSQNSSSTEQTNVSRESYFPYSMYKYAFESQVPKAVRDQTRSSLHLNGPCNGLHTKLHPGKYVCRHCGQLHLCVSGSPSSLSHRRHSSSLTHPLQVLYSAKHWHKPSCKLPVNRYAYDNSAYITDNDELEMKRDHILSKSMRRPTPMHKLHEHIRRANSLDTGLRQLGSAAAGVLLIKTNKAADIAKTVTFKEQQTKHQTRENVAKEAAAETAVLGSNGTSASNNVSNTTSVVVDIEVTSPRLQGILKCTNSENL